MEVIEFFLGLLIRMEEKTFFDILIWMLDLFFYRIKVFSMIYFREYIYEINLFKILIDWRYLMNGSEKSFKYAKID